MDPMTVQRRNPAAEVDDRLVRYLPHLEEDEILVEECRYQIVELMLIELSYYAELSTVVLWRDPTSLDLVAATIPICGVKPLRHGGRELELQVLGHEPFSEVRHRVVPRPD